MLALGHGLKGDILRGLRQADDQPGVLLGKKAFRDHHVEIPGESDGAEHCQKGDEAVTQHDLEAGLIKVEQAIEAPFGKAVKPSVLLALWLQEVCAHHWRERQRDQ